MRASRRGIAAAVSAGLVTLSLPVLAVLGLPAAANAAAPGDVTITEWAYNGSEFFELTNVGRGSADLTGWTYSDSARDITTPGAFLDLSAFGRVAPGESVLVSEADAATFRTDWALDDGVKVIGGNEVNLGRSDEINIYDEAGADVDRLTYNDQAVGTDAGGPRTETSSAWVPEAALGLNTASAWILSTSGDAESSRQHATITPVAFFGSPGISTLGGYDAGLNNSADGLMRITEWQYNGSEFFELTNVGGAAVDMTGWAYTDSARDVVTAAEFLDISAFGSVAPGESVILSEVPAATFRTDWALDETVDVIGGNVINLGRSDEINIYDAADVLVDRLTYDDAGAGDVAGPRTDNSSAWVTAPALDKNIASLWVKSTLDDAEGSWQHTTQPFFGSPGISNFGFAADVPGDGVVLNEVKSNPNPDFVELLNTSDEPVDISDWLAIDDDPLHTPLDFTLEATVLDPGDFFTFNANDAAYGAGAFGLGGNDEINVLLGDGETVVDAFTWEGIDAPGGHADPSYGRCPDGSGELVLNVAATPGAVNDCPVPTEEETIRINEVESNGDVVGDWVELTNIGDATVDVSGWKLRDGGASNPTVSIPGGTTIAPGAFYAIYTEIPPPGFGLGTDDEVTVFHADGTTVADTLAWTDGHAATTYGRCPDGSGDLRVTTVGTRGGPNACSPIRVNEVTTDADAVEIVNISDAPIDIAGWVVKDGGEADPTTLPAPSVVPAHGYLVVDPLAGLGGADSARLFDGTAALIDSATWAEHPLPSLGRCADGVGAFKLTATATIGAENDCPGIATEPWPGSATVGVADEAGTFGQDASGLAFDPADANTLWVAQNKLGTLFKMTKSGGAWTQATGWAGGKNPTYASGTGAPDTEGVAVGPDGGIYLSSERDNDVSGVSKNTVLRYDAAGATGATLTATDEWDVSPLLPLDLGANLGLEGITWVPDTFLLAGGFIDESTSAAYAPADYPGHGTGLYVVAVEGTGLLYVLALPQTAAVQETPELVATVDPRLLTKAGPPGAMDVSYDAEQQRLWAICDDSCDGTTTLLTIESGAFEVEHGYERPAGMPNLNNEGFALAPQSTCVAGAKEVVWADDGDTDGHSLRLGTFPCTVLPDPEEPEEPAAPKASSVAASGATIVYGQAGSVTVTVSASGTTPTGAVTVRSGATTLGSATLAGGSANVAIAAKALAPGTHTLTVAYAGDGSVASGSGTATLTVAKATATIDKPKVKNKPVVATKTRAKVKVKVVATGATPSGTVTISGGGLGAKTAKLGPDGTVTIKLATFKTTGKKKLKVSYAGDAFVSPAKVKLTIRVKATS